MNTALKPAAAASTSPPATATATASATGEWAEDLHELAERRAIAHALGGEEQIAKHHAQGKLTVVHITSLQGARDVVAAGADGLVHAFGDAPIDEALVRTMTTAGRTVLFSGLTVGTSLLGLLLFPEYFLRSLGLGAIGAVLA